MLIRVAEPRKQAFQLRKGEQGLLVFDTESVDPPLTEAEILDAFRAGSVGVMFPVTEVNSAGLRLVPIEGSPVLPERLRWAHAEIQAGAGMTRSEFKRAPKGLE